MGIALLITGGVILLAGIVAMFASETGPSHFDHMLDLYHKRQLAKMEHELELEKVKLQLLQSPLPDESDR